MASKIPRVVFNNGHSIPILGLGTWQSAPGQVEQAVKDAISCGYRHIDCAFCYGNENEVGNGIKAKIQDGTVKREDLFITSKLWLTFYEKDLVVTGIKKSLELLGLTYLDLFLVHWPVAMKTGDVPFPKDDNGKIVFGTGHYLDVWKGMEECVDKGLAKSIGVSNYNKRQIIDVVKNARIQPVVNQVECHPYLSQKPLAKICKENNIVMTAYSSLGTPTRPVIKPEQPILLEDQSIKAIADKYGKTPAQILIRYQIENNTVVIPKSVTKSRIESNFDVFDFELSPDDMKKLENMNSNTRFLEFAMIKGHPEYPFHEEY